MKRMRTCVRPDLQPRDNLKMTLLDLLPYIFSMFRTRGLPLYEKPSPSFNRLQIKTNLFKHKVPNFIGIKVGVFNQKKGAP